MGNVNAHQPFSRRNSKRHSRKTLRVEPKHYENQLKNRNFVSRKEECLQHLKEHVAEFESKLDDYDKEASGRSQEIESLLKVLEGYKSSDITDDSKEDKIDQNVVDETIERIKNIMRQFQELGHSRQSLKESFKDVRSEIDKCVEVYEENIENSKDLMDKSPHGQLHTKKKRHKVKEAKPFREFQHQKTTNIEEQPYEHESRVLAKVQILFTQDGNTMHEIVQELQKELTRRIGSVDFIHLKEKSKVDANMLMIIVCIVTTRVGADAKNAVENIKNRENVALLLVHIGEVHAVSNKNSSLHLTEQEFVNLQGIFDMSFKTGNGFFQCDMNEKSINGLSTFALQNQFSKNYEKEDEIKTEN